MRAVRYGHAFRTIRMCAPSDADARFGRCASTNDMDSTTEATEGHDWSNWIARLEQLDSTTEATGWHDWRAWIAWPEALTGATSGMAALPY